MDGESECLFDPNEIPPLPPPLLFNPLPLQCLAADALPMKLQEEVEDMLDIYANAAAIEPPPEFSEKKELTTMSARPVEDSCPLQQAWSSESLVSSPRHQMTFLLRRKQRSSYQGNDFGVGLKIVGGVNCERCRNLHAVVTNVLPGTECAHMVREGMLVTEWCGKKLDGCSYEHVLWLMSTTEEEVVEIVVREPCVMRPGSTTTFQLRMSGHSSHSSHSSLKGRLSVFLGAREVRQEDVDNSDTSNNSSRRESATGAEEQLEGFFASLPNGMIKLSIQYSRIEEKLGVGLVQVKAHALEGHDEAAIFISVQIIPDERLQELKFAKLHGTPALFHLLPTELAVVALRVTLWESMDIKSAFRGEVLLRVVDKDTVSLNGDPSWYTVCSPDPNLPHLEDPFDYGSNSKSRHVASVESKKGLGTWHSGQKHALKTLFKKATSSSDVQVVVEATMAPPPPVVAERKASLPSAKIPEADGMKLVFATMMKKMKKKYHSETHFQPQSQLQSNSQSSTSLTQSPAQSPGQATGSQSPQAQTRSQSPFHSLQSPLQTQFQINQSHSHIQPTETKSQCTSDPSPPHPALQSGDGGGGGGGGDKEEAGDSEKGNLEKLASIISTLRRELSQSDEELCTLHPPTPPPAGGDEEIAAVGVTREPVDLCVPVQEGSIETSVGPHDPLLQSKGQSTSVVTDVMGWSDLDASTSSGKNLLSDQGNCDHEDIEVCLLDAKKWSEEDRSRFSPNLSPTVAMVMGGIDVDDNKYSYSRRVPACTSTPVAAVLCRAECPGLPAAAAAPSPIAASLPSGGSIPPPSPRSAPHTTLLLPTSSRAVAARTTPSSDDASGRAVAAAGVQGNVVVQLQHKKQQVLGGIEGRAAEKENICLSQEHNDNNRAAHRSGEGSLPLVPLSDVHTASSSEPSRCPPSNNSGAASVPKCFNVYQKQADEHHSGQVVRVSTTHLPPSCLLSPEQQLSMRHPATITATSATATSSRPVHFQSKHRSRSLNDILTSSGEESSASAASHCTVGVAPTRDIGVAAVASTRIEDATFQVAQDKPVVANNSGSLGRGDHKLMGSGSKMVAFGAFAKQSRKEKVAQVMGKRHHNRRSSLTALSPRSPNPPLPADGATPHSAAHPWLLMAGGVASVHTKGHSWYSNLFGRKKGRSQEERMDRPRPLGELQKSKSTENVLGHEQGTQKPHDQRRRGSHASIHPMAEPKKAEDIGERGLPLGSIQLSFSYSPQTPALQVTLTDIVMLSSKGLFSDFKLKMRVLHTSSGVCLTKHKTSVNYKRGVVKPNAEFQFFMEVQNLSLQVLISVPGTRMFSRKSYMEAWIDLNQLGLTENKALSKWFEVQKQATLC